MTQEELKKEARKIALNVVIDKLTTDNFSDREDAINEYVYGVPINFQDDEDALEAFWELIRKEYDQIVANLRLELVG